MASLKFTALFLLIATFANAQKCLEGNCFDGIGKAQYAKGSYEGSFKDGVPDGFGVQIDQTGTYVGYFKEGRSHGKGLLTYKDGSSVEGMFENGKMVTQIQDSPAKRSDGSKCLEGDCKTGYGTLDFPKGDKYQGNFVNGAMHGQGNLFFNNGIVLSGKFENNKLVSGEMFGENKSYYYKGTFQNSKPWNGEFYSDESKEWTDYENGKPVEKKARTYTDHGAEYDEY